MSTIRALVAVRDKEWQEALDRLLKNHFCQVSITTDGLELFRLAGRRHFDIVLLDDFLTRVGAAEAVLNLREICPDSTVVVLGNRLEKWAKVWRYCQVFAAVPYSKSLDCARRAMDHARRLRETEAAPIYFG